MPIPRELLKAAFAALPEETLRAVAHHCLDDEEPSLADMMAELRGMPMKRNKWDKMPVAKLIDALASDDSNLRSYTIHLSTPDLERVARVFGLDHAKPREGGLSHAIFSFCLNYDRIQVTRKAREKAGTLPQFSGKDLIAEGANLQRRVLHLRPKLGGQPIAVWSAERDIKAQGSRVWISVNLRRHPDDAIRRAGVLDVYVNVPKGTGYCELRTGRLHCPKDGKRYLYATEVWEKPPLELLLIKGSRKLQTWLDDMKQRGWNLRKSPHDASFPLQDVLQAYEKSWQSKHPLCGKSPYAQLGGWPVGWPDEPAEEQLRRKLVLRTYRASEPWVEVFQTSRGYQVCARIT